MIAIHTAIVFVVVTALLAYVLGTISGEGARRNEWEAGYEAGKRDAAKEEK